MSNIEKDENSVRLKKGKAPGCNNYLEMWTVDNQTQHCNSCHVKGYLCIGADHTPQARSQGSLVAANVGAGVSYGNIVKNESRPISLTRSELRLKVNESAKNTKQQQIDQKKLELEALKVKIEGNGVKKRKQKEEVTVVYDTEDEESKEDEWTKNFKAALTSPLFPSSNTHTGSSSNNIHNSSSHPICSLSPQHPFFSLSKENQHNIFRNHKIGKAKEIDSSTEESYRVAVAALRGRGDEVLWNDRASDIAVVFPIVKIGNLGEPYYPLITRADPIQDFSSYCLNCLRQHSLSDTFNCERCFRWVFSACGDGEFCCYCHRAEFELQEYWKPARNSDRHISD